MTMTMTGITRTLASRTLALLLLSVPLYLHADSDVAQGGKVSGAKIVVSGQGRVQVAADMAILRLTVTREAATAEAALTANSEAMAAVLAAMKARGIDRGDLQTAQFDIQPQREYPGRQSGGKDRAPRIVGYTVRNTLTVRLRDINSVGAVLDEAVRLGVNEGGNIRFANADTNTPRTRARTLAVQDALARAETLAKAAGVKLGPVLQITEQSNRAGPAPMARAEMSLAADAVPLASGDNSYRVTVEVVLCIE